MSLYFEWLDDYMEGKLTPQQRLDFEQAMKGDEKLRHAVEKRLFNKVCLHIFVK